MEPHDLEIEIGKDGRVRVKTAGTKGQSCLKYIRLLERIVGTTEARELKAEYYEPDSIVEIDGALERRQRQRRQE